MKSTVAWGILATFVVLGACGGDPRPGALDAAADSVSDGACPAGWVVTRWGGCGPAVVLCEADGGAAAGACANVDTHVPRSIPEDGGVGTTLYRMPDGAVGGGWVRAGIDRCPSGWRAVADGTCDPNMTAACPPGAERVPSGGCAGTSACGNGTFPASIAPGPRGRILRVRAGATDDGADGSEARPYGRLARALDAVGEGGVVLIADGTYRENIVVQRPVTLLGHCAANVVIDGPTGAAEGVVFARGAAASLDLRDVTIRGAAIGLRASEGARVSARNVAIEGAQDIGVAAIGAGTTLRFERSVVRGTRPRADGLSVGASLTEGAVGVFSESALMDSGAMGVALRTRDEGSSASLGDVLLLGSNRAGEPSGLVGAIVLAASAASLERVVVEGFTFEGIDSTAEEGMVGGSVEVRDAIIRSMRSRTPSGGAALAVQRQGAMDAERVLIDDVQGFGGIASREGSLTIRSSVIRRVRSASAPGAGVGVNAAPQGSVALDRVRVEACRTGAAASEGASLSVVDSAFVGMSEIGLLASDPGRPASSETRCSATSVRKVRREATAS